MHDLISRYVLLGKWESEGRAVLFGTAVLDHFVLPVIMRYISGNLAGNLKKSSVPDKSYLTVLITYSIILY